MLLINTLYFIFKPDWLTYTFDLNDLDSAETFVYQGNILADGKLSLLASLAGCEDNVPLLCQRLAGLDPRR